MFGENLHHRLITSITDKWQWITVYVRSVSRKLWYRAQEDHTVVAASEWRSWKTKQIPPKERIAQGERKEWKKEAHKYFVALRSTPHTTTDVSPAELLFGRKMRIELPELSEEDIASEMRDKDGEMKANAKQYTIQTRRGMPRFHI